MLPSDPTIFILSFFFLHPLVVLYSRSPPPSSAHRHHHYYLPPPHLIKNSGEVVIYLWDITKVVFSKFYGTNCIWLEKKKRGSMFMYAQLSTFFMKIQIKDDAKGWHCIWWRSRRYKYIYVCVCNNERDWSHFSTLKENENRVRTLDLMKAHGLACVFWISCFLIKPWMPNSFPNAKESTLCFPWPFSFFPFPHFLSLFYLSPPILVL